MLARLQQVIVLSWAASFVAWICWALSAGGAIAVLAGAVLWLGAHPAILALEFVLMHHVNVRATPDGPVPGGTLKAWWGEVRGATQVFGWRQPFCSNAVADVLRPDDRRGVVLIHGFVCNRGLWNPWLRRLTAERRAFVAVNLEPIFGSIDDYVAAIEAAVTAVEAATGRSPVIVAHSMGGLALRRWWVEPANASRLHHAITIGTPHAGTWLARFALSTNGRQMRIGSHWLEALRAREPADRGQRMTCFYGPCDNIVFPTSTARYAGAEARLLPAVAHVRMADCPEPWAELQRRLQD